MKWFPFVWVRRSKVRFHITSLSLRGKKSYTKPLRSSEWKWIDSELLHSSSNCWFFISRHSFEREIVILCCEIVSIDLSSGPAMFWLRWAIICGRSWDSTNFIINLIGSYHSESHRPTFTQFHIIYYERIFVAAISKVVKFILKFYWLNFVRRLCKTFDINIWQDNLMFSSKKDEKWWYYKRVYYSWAIQKHNDMKKANCWVQ